MPSWLKHRKISIGHQIYAIVVLSVAALVSVTAYELATLRSATTQQRHLELRHLVQLAHGIVQQEYDAYKSGAISEDAAKRRALERVKSLRYGGGDYFWINDMHPRMVMHPTRPELNGADLTSNVDPSGKLLFMEFVRVVRTDGEGFVDYSWPKPGSEAAVPKISFVAGFKPWGWVLGTGVYVDDLHNQIWQEAKTSFAFAIFILAMLIGLALAVARPMTKSIRDITAVMRDLANGNIEVALPVPRYRDEVAGMVETVAVFKSNLIERKRLESMAQEAEIAKKENFKRLSAMLDEFKTGATKVLSLTRERMVGLRATSNILSTQSASASAKANSALSATEKTADSMHTVASATEEMSASIRQINQQIVQTQNVVSNATSLSQQASTNIAQLTTSSEKIGGIVGLISGVASQTGLLALNAAIEAARAGDAGRGFAVVAQEVKALAAQTSRAAEEISTLVGQMQAVSQSSVTSLQEIIEIIHQVQSLTEEVGRAVVQQESATEEIAQSATSVAAGSSVLAADISSVRSVIAETTDAAGTLLKISSELEGQGQTLAAEIETFILALRTGPLDRRQGRDPSYRGPERRNVDPGPRFAANRAAA